jgi:dTDP-4-dehydrorhamnose reductase
MRVAIFGATGLLGKALMKEWRADEITGLGSKDVDIRSAEQVQAAVRKHRPQYVVLAAAYTDVDGCETHSQLAFDVNCSGAINVAKACQQDNIALLFMSTDYVFDGEKRAPYEIDDPVNPQTVYGKSKAAAEAEIRSIHPECCILRTAWVFGVGGKCFPDTILKLAERKSELDVVNDQVGSPTYTVDLARTIVQLCHKNARGIVHATNYGTCTWFDFAREIVAEANMKTHVRPTTSDRFVRPAKRPQYSVLSPRSLAHWGLEMPGWQDATRRYLVERTLPTAQQEPNVAIPE